jgi:superoxide dismutase, Fe-Mn family
MKHGLPPLPYPVDALEPFLSRETLEYHHGKHHKAYVDKTNELVRGTDLQDATLEQIVASATNALYNNAAQAWNHAFYWRCLTPDGVGKPTGEIARVIASAFGSFDGFQTQFSRAAEGQFGSGWAWLVQRKDGALEIASTANADTPLRSGGRPLLTCDVWEHAYYIDYRNSRADYIKAFWNLVNWEFIARNWAETPRVSTVLSET